MANKTMKTLTVYNDTYIIVDETARQNIGDLTGLKTTKKNNLVEAINELSKTGGIIIVEQDTTKGSGYATRTHTEIQELFNTGFNVFFRDNNGMLYRLLNNGNTIDNASKFCALDTLDSKLREHVVLIYNDYTYTSTINTISSSSLPSGGVEGQVLTKDANGDAIWVNAPTPLPAGGTEGQVLTKAADGSVVWSDPPEGGGGGTLSVPSAQGVMF